MTELEMWSLIAGFCLPPVQAFLQQTHWPNRIRAGVNFLCCCAVALGVVYFTGDVDFKDWVKSGLTVLVAAIAVYHGLWKPTTIAPKIEQATNTTTTKRTAAKK